jgi:hypothetical protein
MLSASVRGCWADESVPNGRVAPVERLCNCLDDSDREPFSAESEGFSPE